ncbi:hypothetical protein T484DRAFT_1922165, partial [Baffinella frigidus]
MSEGRGTPKGRAASLTWLAADSKSPSAAIRCPPGRSLLGGASAPLMRPRVTASCTPPTAPTCCGTRSPPRPGERRREERLRDPVIPTQPCVHCCGHCRGDNVVLLFEHVHARAR